MTTIKTLMLAGAAALSLGAGVASAQSLTPSGAEATYFQGQAKAVPAPVVSGAKAGQQTSQQYGSSDFEQSKTIRDENILSSGVAGGL